MQEHTNGTGELPKGWKSTPLMDIVELHDSRRIPLNSKQRAERQGPYAYYGANGQVDSIDEYLFEGNYVLLAEDGGYFDDPSRGVAYEVSGRFWVNNHAHILSPKYDIPLRYLTYALNNIDWMPFVGGSTRLKLTQEGMRKVRLPLPPLAEQRRIVAKLDALFAHTQRARAELARVPKLIECARQAVLAKAFAGELVKPGFYSTNESSLQNRNHQDGESSFSDFGNLQALPGGWTYTYLAPLLSTTRRGMKTGPFGSALKKSDHQSYGVPVLGIENIGRMKFIPGNKTFITEEKAAELSEYDAQASDILISRSGTVGEVCVVPDDLGDARISTNLIRVVLNQSVIEPQFFAMLFVGSPNVLNQVSELCAGTTRDFLNQTILSSIVFPLPPILEQRQIIAAIEAAFARIERMAAEAHRAAALLDRLEQAALAKAFRGELSQDGADDADAALADALAAAPAASSGDAVQMGLGLE